MQHAHMLHRFASSMLREKYNPFWLKLFLNVLAIKTYNGKCSRVLGSDTAQSDSFITVMLSFSLSHLCRPKVLICLFVLVLMTAEWSVGCAHVQPLRRRSVREGQRLKGSCNHRRVLLKFCRLFVLKKAIDLLMHWNGFIEEETVTILGICWAHISVSSKLNAQYGFNPFVCVFFPPILF